MANTWVDNPQRYGAISRLFHWSMAALLAWQFAGMVGKVAFDLAPANSALVRSHGPIGLIILVLLVLRLAWAITNRGKRPAQAKTLWGTLARCGHAALYLLMAIVPLLALMRAYGSGRGFSPWGIQVFEPTGVRVEWLVAPANAVHGLLGWIMLALIVGHVMMALAHQLIWRDDVMRRMWG